MDFRYKYLKYKKKYINLKKITGGTVEEENNNSNQQIRNYMLPNYEIGQIVFYYANGREDGNGMSGWGQPAIIKSIFINDNYEAIHTIDVFGGTNFDLAENDNWNNTEITNLVRIDWIPWYKLTYASDNPNANHRLEHNTQIQQNLKIIYDRFINNLINN
jgi:hypothetical protein